MVHRISRTQAAVIGLVSAASVMGTMVPTAQAADAVVKDGIVGSDVMGEKGHGGPDGWAWAPVTRDQGASSAAPGQSANAGKALNAQPAGGAGKTLSPGQDPGTPATADANGPGSLDQPISAKSH